MPSALSRYHCTEKIITASQGASLGGNEWRVAQIPAVALLGHGAHWNRRRSPAPGGRSSCSAMVRRRGVAQTEPEGTFSFSDLIRGLKLAPRPPKRDNLRRRGNTDAKISHSNLGPSRFELVVALSGTNWGRKLVGHCRQHNDLVRLLLRRLSSYWTLNTTKRTTEATN